jgi:hypothetical protein
MENKLNNNKLLKLEKLLINIFKPLIIDIVVHN